MNLLLVVGLLNCSLLNKLGKPGENMLVMPRWWND